MRPRVRSIGSRGSELLPVARKFHRLFRPADPGAGQPHVAPRLAVRVGTGERPRERLNEGLSSKQAALQAGYVRIRPVLMTALAMIIGMVPLSLGLGEGGEQNAPLGRAVIGGLIIATFATLFFVPCVFSLVHRRHRPGQRAGAALVNMS